MNIFELGQSLKKARIAMRFTQSELATKTGVSLSSISGLERGTLLEIGAVKLIVLFAAVGLEIHVRPQGVRRTLDDAKIEFEDIKSIFPEKSARYEPEKVKLRVRHPRKNKN